MTVSDINTAWFQSNIFFILIDIVFKIQFLVINLTGGHIRVHQSIITCMINDYFPLKDTPLICSDIQGPFCRCRGRERRRIGGERCTQLTLCVY